MNQKFMIYFKIITTLLSLMIINNSDALAQNSWAARFPGIGTFSSPRVADLNNDSIGDIILGAGREEFQVCDSAVMAINGKTGKLLWNVSAKDQIFGSATLRDINNDGIADIFIGGRSAQLIAIDGKSGGVIWRFVKPESPKREWFNFYNPQFIRDQNDDGQEDILVSNGGDVLAEPYDANRPPGYLVILDSKNGHIISKATMPDGKETYMSVAVLTNDSGNYGKVIYGTGGETIGGNLFITSIKEIKSGDLSNSAKLASSENKGFIGPPAWVDINGDGIHDIVANAVDGRLLAFDGKTNELIWKVGMLNTEAYSSLAIGNFTNDSVPDFFISYAQGVWPRLEWSKQFMVNGSNGNIEFIDSLGFYQTSTPVIFDLNGDGIDEALLSVNYQVFDSLQFKYFHNMLVVINFMGKEVLELGLNYEGHNISSTPWVGDIDNNGFLDIIYFHGTNVKQTYTFDGLEVNRIDTQIPVTGKIKWGAYMGSEYNGIFNR